MAAQVQVLSRTFLCVTFVQTELIKDRYKERKMGSPSVSAMKVNTSFVGSNCRRQRQHLMVCEASCTWGRPLSGKIKSPTVHAEAQSPRKGSVQLSNSLSNSERTTSFWTDLPGNLPGRFFRNIIYQLKASLSCRYFCEVIEGSRAGLLVLKFSLYQTEIAPLAIYHFELTLYRLQWQRHHLLSHSFIPQMFIKHCLLQR